MKKINLKPNILNKVHKKYQEVQLLKLEEKRVELSKINDLENNWKDDRIPILQRQVIDIQLDNMKKGVIDPVFSSLIKALRVVKLHSFSLLDIGCAIGYYFEVIKTLDKRDILYRGCDYSGAMINTAKKYYTEVKFDIQDAKALNYPDKSFDAVMISGVLEHIQSYPKVIASALRVAKQYAIFHRTPLIAKLENEYTIGSQYTIETPRIYFSRKRIIDECAE